MFYTLYEYQVNLFILYVDNLKKLTFSNELGSFWIFLALEQPAGTQDAIGGVGLLITIIIILLSLAYYCSACTKNVRTFILYRATPLFIQPITILISGTKKPSNFG